MAKIIIKESPAVETRLIKCTSKRQITIPKSYFDILSLEHGVTFVAQLFDDGIFLSPYIKSEDSIWDEDRKEIIRGVVKEGFTEEEMVEEINFRIKKYDEFLLRKIEEFDSDIMEDEKSLGDTLGVTNFNGLDIFFDSEIETPAKEP